MLVSLRISFGSIYLLLQGFSSLSPELSSYFSCRYSLVFRACLYDVYYSPFYSWISSQVTTYTSFIAQSFRICSQFSIYFDSSSSCLDLMLRSYSCDLHRVGVALVSLTFPADSSTLFVQASYSSLRQPSTLFSASMMLTFMELNYLINSSSAVRKLTMLLFILSQTSSICSLTSLIILNLRMTSHDSTMFLQPLAWTVWHSLYIFSISSSHYFSKQDEAFFIVFSATLYLVRLVGDTIVLWAGLELAARTCGLYRWTPVRICLYSIKFNYSFTYGSSKQQTQQHKSGKLIQAATSRSTRKFPLIFPPFTASSAGLSLFWGMRWPSACSF